jgi:hypothetical protein
VIVVFTVWMLGVPFWYGWFRRNDYAAIYAIFWPFTGLTSLGIAAVEIIERIVQDD